MKTTLYILLALFMSTAFYSCTPEAIQETTELSTEGDDSGEKNEHPDPDGEID